MGLLETITSMIGGKGNAADQIMKAIAENEFVKNNPQVMDFIKKIDPSQVQAAIEYLQKNGIPKDAAGISALVSKFSAPTKKK